ncbi:hypothetical protein DA102_033950 [Sinorhizobium meliloti]|nr:hypothetical protein DA102_033950 [Sinorhizobium meliloti]
MWPQAATFFECIWANTDYCSGFILVNELATRDCDGGSGGDAVEEIMGECDLCEFHDRDGFGNPAKHAPLASRSPMPKHRLDIAHDAKWPFRR